MVDRIADIWGTRTPHAKGTRWPVRVDTALAEGVSEGDVEKWVQSACTLCSNGCGCDIAVADGRMVGVRGRAVDTVNHGRLGPKGLFGSWQGMGRRRQNRGDRLTRPLIREGGTLVETDWGTAMTRIVDRSRTLLEERGPLSHGFYTSGQLFLEEYYTLAVIGKAGIGTPHMDGNTRLCTATSAAAMKESFGSDGQPGSYEDIDWCEAMFLWGHNMAETQTVLWMRVLDRLHGPDRPALVCVDPRRTAVAREADVHLALRNGTNQALVNGILREIVHRGWVDEDYVAAHTCGLEDLVATVEPWTPERTAEVCDVPADDVRRAAEIFGTSDRVLSTVLEGFYQSHQATAAACGVNNLHLLRGMIGKPGGGILQMNGQPTAQNTRECGADGDMPAFRNWDNPRHIAELARLWDVDPLKIPSWSPPTHAMQIFRYAEQGSIGLLWISATNPAVSMPDSGRIRRILASDELFVVVQDLYENETTEFADVVLPAAGWGEKQGTFTNVNRTVHLSEKAVDPPGEARSDLDIFLDYARRMDFRDRSGRPLPPWSTPEEAFDAWRDCTRGRLCDYTGLSYDQLRGGSGVPWPCNDEAPDGTVRLYSDGVFPTASEAAETYGHDLLTGAAVSAADYAALAPDGRALLKGADYVPSPEEPDDEYPLRYTTGRTVYQFHTRTRTGRAPQLQAAAPTMWIELAAEDAHSLGVSEGDRVRVVSRRGHIVAAARIAGGRPGVVFAPFHYGARGPDADQPPSSDEPTAANELTRTQWDPVSKQPLFKFAAVRVERLGSGDGPAPAPTTTASAPVDPAAVPPTRGRGGVVVREDIAPVEPPKAASEELS
ncbi:nitrate reductase [Blastococcus sp. TF02-09]|uniref:molybdopterin oxidoreductase family protein n=1 Tax=Blastococcus sp. TF02-09 TaxID=2250576 RepID=UPI000DE816CB|nr:nitrate reductase [Blastococcus sp. TF02-9]RBY78482.1 nitrate reductase [Blastococcus sp. TF02-9]